MIILSYLKLYNYKKKEENVFGTKCSNKGFRTLKPNVKQTNKIRLSLSELKSSNICYFYKYSFGLVSSSNGMSTFVWYLMLVPNLKKYRSGIIPFLGVLVWKWT